MTRMCVAALAFAILAVSRSRADEAETDEADHVEPFAPTCEDCALFESFEDDAWTDRWVNSVDEKYNGEVQRVARDDDGIVGDHAIKLPTSHRHYGLSSELVRPFENTDGFVVQYEVALLDQLDCGGAYLKLLSESPREALVDSTPYSIMFGPDKCGYTNKVHVIFRHVNAKTGDVEEKHLAQPPTFPTDTNAHTYTLVVGSDNTYDVLIDGESKKSGSLFEDFTPPFQPPEEIPDQDDVKPSDWVDMPKMEDPTDDKPDDWDEDAPMYIPDEDAEKPAEWEDDEPLEIPDPDAVMPDDWDEEEDGDFEAPLVPNPKCIPAGCGEWVRPEIRNPDYKGKWTPRMIDNPDYIGEWEPRNITNPAYYVVEHVADFTPIKAVAIEVWVTNKDIVFDNVLIASDKAVAKAVADYTWAPRHEVESARQAKSLLSQGKGLGDSMLEFMMENRMACIVGAVVVLGLLYALTVGPAAPPAPVDQHKKDDDTSAPDDAEEEEEDDAEEEEEEEQDGDSE